MSFNFFFCFQLFLFPQSPHHFLALLSASFPLPSRNPPSPTPPPTLLFLLQPFSKRLLWRLAWRRRCKWIRGLLAGAAAGPAITGGQRQTANMFVNEELPWAPLLGIFNWNLWGRGRGRLLEAGPGRAAGTWTYRWWQTNGPKHTLKAVWGENNADGLWIPWQFSNPNNYLSDSREYLLRCISNATTCLTKLNTFWTNKPKSFRKTTELRCTYSEQIFLVTTRFRADNPSRQPERLTALSSDQAFSDPVSPPRGRGGGEKGVRERREEREKEVYTTGMDRQWIDFWRKLNGRETTQEECWSRQSIVHKLWKNAKYNMQHNSNFDMYISDPERKKWLSEGSIRRYFKQL